MFEYKNIKWFMHNGVLMPMVPPDFEIDLGRQDQKNYLSYALFYEMNQHYLEERGFRYVHDGARSLSHETNVQEFLVDKFKFRKAFCKLHIAYRYDISLIVKMLYPFRRAIYKSGNAIGKKLAVLLHHEEIRRRS